MLLTEIIFALSMIILAMALQASVILLLRVVKGGNNILEVWVLLFSLCISLVIIVIYLKWNARAFMGTAIYLFGWNLYVGGFYLREKYREYKKGKK